MPGGGDAAFDAYFPADLVLSHADIAVVVTDRLSNIRYVNEFAAGLFRVSGDVTRLAGCPLEALACSPATARARRRTWLVTCCAASPGRGPSRARAATGHGR